MIAPRVTDDDRGEISVTLDGHELRGWSYRTRGEQREKMIAAREYVEGYCDGLEAEGKMSDSILDLGLLSVETKPVTAFAGFSGRVYPNERAALIDLAMNELAKVWLSKCGTGAPTFTQIMNYMEIDPDLTDAAAKLARYKTQTPR